MNRFVVAVFVLILESCTSLHQIRTNPRECVQGQAETGERCRSNSLVGLFEPSREDSVSPPVMAFVEYDDLGAAWDPSQVAAAVGKVRGILQDSAHDAIIVVFVHGWQHNAEYDDENVRAFEDVVRGLAKDEMRKAEEWHLPARKVVGVYAAWRGQTIRLPVAKHFTFWRRKQVADAVGRGAINQLLGTLRGLRDVRNAQTRNRRTKLIVMGHSFGGHVVFSALSNSIQLAMASGRVTGRDSLPIEGFADLVAVVNPAFEASRYTPIHDFMVAHQDFPKDQQLLLATISSEADQATRIAFPLGRAFSTGLTSYRDADVYPQGRPCLEQRADNQAIGHFVEYRTHRLGVAGAGAKGILQSIPSRWLNNGYRVPETELEIHPVGNRIANRPAILVTTSPEVMKGHNDIANPRILSFLKFLASDASSDFEKPPGSPGSDSIVAVPEAP